MKIESIEVHDVLSFRDARLELNPALTVLVGPNGAGKTNVVRLLDMVLTAVRAFAIPDDRIRERLDKYRSARRIGAGPDSRSSVTISIDLNEHEDRDLLTAFVREATVAPALHGLPIDPDAPTPSHRTEMTGLIPAYTGSDPAELTRFLRETQRISDVAATAERLRATANREARRHGTQRKPARRYPR